MKFEIGDLVYIKDAGHHYSSWCDMFKQLGFSNPDVYHCFKPNRDHNEIYIIFNSTPHPYNNSRELYAVRNSYGEEHLLHQDGLGRIEDLINSGINVVIPDELITKIVITEINY